VSSAPHVLVIEDDDDVRRLVSTWLGRLGCTVTECATGRAGLDIITAPATERPLDLVLLDVLLPDIDGGQIYRRLRRRGDVPVLVMSIVDAGAISLSERDAVLAKPFRRRDLEQAVRRLIHLPAESPNATQTGGAA
jgi:CheY-like chemotaxis protein